MKKIAVEVGIFLLKIIYLPMKLLRTKNKVVYISRQYNKETLDFILLKNEIEKLDTRIQNVFLTKRIEKGLVNAISYVFHIMKQMYHISTAKIVVVDTYCIAVSVLKHKNTTKIIQIWHALGAIKKFGYQTIGKTSGASKMMAEVMHMHKNYDFVLCASEATKKHYCEAFQVQEDQIKYMGMPRIDYILQKKNKEKIYERYPELRNKINVLYVPTFRKGKKIKINQLIRDFNTKKYNLILKLHPLDHRQYHYEPKEGVIFEEEFKSYDLLEIADKVITDYSSLSIEVALLNKPIYFYTYDIEEYEQDPGLNFDFSKEEIGKYVARTPESLLALLEKEYDDKILERFKNKYITVNINHCANQLAKYILELMNHEYKKEIEKEFNPNSQEELNV